MEANTDHSNVQSEELALIVTSYKTKIDSIDDEKVKVLVENKDNY